MTLRGRLGIHLQDVRTIGPNHTSLVVMSFKGYVTPLLDNPHHKPELIRMASL